jgi:peptidoglycan-associated lipoprotein
MKRRMVTISTVLMFVCSSVLLMTSCAKKQLGMGETTQPITKESAMKEKGAREGQKGTLSESEAYKAREAERQARLREAEKELAGQIEAFDAEKIYFDFDQADLKPEARAVLEKKAEWLRAHPSYSLWIDGNCDERGTEEYNLALGERRAHAAKKYLMDLGIAGDRIRTISYGEEKPVDPGHDEEAWAKNRRDDFRLFK